MVHLFFFFLFASERRRGRSLCTELEKKNGHWEGLLAICLRTSLPTRGPALFHQPTGMKVLE